MIDHITPVLITKDAEAHLKECLSSLKPFKEVILFDNGSTDDTLFIALQFPNVKIVHGEFKGFGPTKNEAAGYATNEWIFSIDSDEIASKELVDEIRAIRLEDNKVYAIDRHNLFLGERVRHSGWSPDWVKRLYNKNFTHFNDNLVHESIVAKDIKRLKGPLVHYAVDDVTDFLLKTARYSKLSRPNQKPLTPGVAFFRALFAFFRTYFLKRGFLDGYAGLVISVGNFNGVFFKYLHAYYKRRR